MGYRLDSRRTYRLHWPEGHELHGLQAVAHGLTVGEYAEYLEPSNTPRDVLLIDLFASHLESWDLEDHDGTPVEPTREAINAIPADIVLSAAVSWLNRAVSTLKPAKPAVGAVDPLALLPTSEPDPETI